MQATTGIWTIFFGHGGLVLGLNKFEVMPNLAYKLFSALKAVKSDTKFLMLLFLTSL